MHYEASDHGDNKVLNVSTSPKLRRRIVAVQGGVQLASALAAMRVSDSRGESANVENHLIVHDLSSPSDQCVPFADCLQSLAAQVGTWGSTRYLALADMLRLQATLKPGGWEAAIKVLQAELQFDQCDELLLGQNMLFINNLLSRSFPSAQKACYGDGIGLNFSADYYSPGAGKPSGLRRIERWIRNRIRALRGKSPAEVALPMKSKKHAVAFDKHYLLLANQFDQKLPRYEQLHEADFSHLFSQFSHSLPQLAPSTCAQLESELAKTQQVIVLLTSNFSETKRMTVEGEVACCMEMVLRKQNKPNALLVVKPHPRDSQEKIAAIGTEARKTFASVITLSDPWTFFIPFESIFDRYFMANPRVRSMTSVVCSSSACISLEMLYGQQCELGFGAKNVRRYFAQQWKELRVRHESDLNQIVRRIRHSTHRRVAA